MPLPPAIRERARTLLLLSLGSDSEGERQNANSALKKLLKTNGCDLHDMAGALVEEAPPPTPPAPPAPREPRIRSRADGEGYEVPAVDLLPLLDAVRASGPLDFYNTEFVGNMAERAARWRIVFLTERQLGHLTRLLETA